MNFLHSLWMGAAIAALTACTGMEVKETLGLERRAPDEFRVVSRPPLSVPSEFYLVPPQPGEGAFSKEQADIRARSLVTGQRITTLDNLDSANDGLADTAAPVVTTSSLPSPAESSILQKVGASSADPSIKEKLYEDYRSTKTNDSDFLDKLRGEGEGDPVVDAKGEADRLKKNKETNKPANEGEVPVVDPKEKSVLERVFD